MNKILILTTGGTVASRKNSETGGILSGSIAGDNLIEMVPNLNVPIEVKEIYKKPSSYLGPDEMMKLSRVINCELKKKDINGIVVTHGTDTLEESSYFVDLVVKSDKPIIFTGSQRGPSETGSDSISNILDSIRVAADKNSWGKGVQVVFNEQIHSARFVTKNDANNRQGFSSPNLGPIGFVDKSNIYYYMKPKDDHYFPIDRINVKVDLIKVVAGIDNRYINSSIDNKVEGLVIEGFGRGHVTPYMANKIGEAVDIGMIVVVVSRCHKGFVDKIYDFRGGGVDLSSKGVILAPGMIGQKARIKLLIALSYTKERRNLLNIFAQ